MKPWAPLFSIKRSDAPEVAVEGVLSVLTLDKNDKVEHLLSVGDTGQTFWSRSLLKPWQLCSHLPELVNSYPDLSAAHFALFAASHRADLEHLCLLRQIMQIGQVETSFLKCPPALPHSSDLKNRLRDDGIERSSLFHNCSGKHFGYLLALKAKGMPLETYIDPSASQFRPLVDMLSGVTGREPASFKPTVDGCQLPNYALSPDELARMYLLLLRADVNFEGEDFRRKYGDLATVMRSYPRIVGGDTSLDSRIMLGKLSQPNPDLRLLSKVGADGLLAISIDGVKRYPRGIGILIKIQAGGIESHLEKVVKEVFRQLEISDKSESTEQSHIRVDFNFNLNNGRN